MVLDFPPSPSPSGRQASVSRKLPRVSRSCARSPLTVTWNTRRKRPPSSLELKQGTFLSLSGNQVNRTPLIYVLDVDWTLHLGPSMAGACMFQHSRPTSRFSSLDIRSSARQMIHSIRTTQTCGLPMASAIPLHRLRRNMRHPQHQAGLVRRSAGKRSTTGGARDT